ncbi:thiol-disulfide isomerase/thioredoxin [Rhodanobacter sp. ANJX3]|uniref:TlpA family protein disulfide reductase n=1 Tax=Rhodanobacter sp. ANJX3 TaxID=2723083 RepID=UPI00161108E9|nr:TlpA disulfide reductase family protein [Rhodanobacter sp. ANJX3]MBB5358755.1 thiol-disulfide isomerase/thioredoxin [Rhodanobacter sp. ANJX3]
MRKMIFAWVMALICVSANAQIQPGAVPPDSLGKTPSGDSVSLASMRDKVVVISFWATWCTYCMKELPVLAGLQKLATDRHLPLQVVSIDHKEGRDVYLRTVRVLRPRLPGLLMSWDRDGSIGKPFGTNKGIPVMVMLHRDGTVADIHVGYSEDALDGLIAEINTLMAEPSALPTASSSSATQKTLTSVN